MYDFSLETAEVVSVIKKESEYTEVIVKNNDGSTAKAVAYTKLTGKLCPGDKVLLNTTAVKLKLGTGGFHIVIAVINKQNETFHKNKKGHIMKLRYTPYQLRTRCVEEEYPYKINDFNGLDEIPVIIIPLHSLLAPLVITYKHYFPDNKVVYIMTEGGALPLALSNQLRFLQYEKLIYKTITIGNSFGGDYETVNIFTGLAAAKKIANADLIVVGMGPGIVGTGTKYGFSGTENAFINYAVKRFNGRSIIVPRISFADKRKRHFGISHHTVTILRDLIKDSVEVFFPEDKRLIRQLKQLKIEDKHQVYFYSSKKVYNILNKTDFEFFSMGRSLKDDPLFFTTAGLPILHLQGKRK